MVKPDHQFHVVYKTIFLLGTNIEQDTDTITLYKTFSKTTDDGVLRRMTGSERKTKYRINICTRQDIFQSL